MQLCTLSKLSFTAIGRLARTTGCLRTVHLGCSSVHPKRDGGSVADSALQARPHWRCLGHCLVAVGRNYRSDLDAYISRPGKYKNWNFCMLAQCQMCCTFLTVSLPGRQLYLAFLLFACLHRQCNHDISWLNTKTLAANNRTLPRLQYHVHKPIFDCVGETKTSDSYCAAAEGACKYFWTC